MRDYYRSLPAWRGREAEVGAGSFPGPRLIFGFVLRPMARDGVVLELLGAGPATPLGEEVQLDGRTLLGFLEEAGVVDLLGLGERDLRAVSTRREEIDARRSRR